MSEELLKSVLTKIDEDTITCNDFDELIIESMPESIRDRVRRRTLKTNTRTHLDDDDHQKLKLPSFQNRVAPKRQPANQQGHGRSKQAHRQSARTQSRQFQEELSFITKHIGKPLSECDYTTQNKRNLLIVANKLMAVPNINRDWLSEFSKHLRQ